MNHLATSATSVSLKINQFNLSSFFYTESYFFKKITLGERALTIIEKLCALLLLIVMLPAMLFVGVAIRATMGKNVFYKQIRIGKDGKKFQIIKFRSMVENAEEKTGPVLSGRDDPRVTRLGKFLRASHLDEIPQLLNVIAGDMSFVGPRPERPEFVEIFEREIAGYTQRKMVRPGITGLAQICLPYDATAEEKLEYDLFYIANQSSLIFNIMISYYTALKMFTFFKNIQ